MAAGVNAVEHDVAAETGGGNQTINLPSGFGTPKAYMVWASNAISDGTEVAHIVFSYGMASGATDEVCMAGSSEDAQGTSDTYREHVDDGVILLHNGTTGATDGKANHVSFSADTIVINWSNAPSAGVRLHFLVLGGDDLTATVGTFTITNDENVGQTVDVGHDVDCVLFGGNTLGFPGSASRNYYGSFGGATPGIVQGSMGCVDQDSAGTTLTTSVVRNDYVNFSWNSGSGSHHRWFDVTGFPTDGFEVTKRNNNEDINFFYMALASSTNSFFTGIIASPSAGTGEKTTTGIGFKPQAAVVGAQLNTTVNNFATSGTDPGAMAISIFSIFDGTRKSCVSFRSEDTADTSVCKTRWDSQALFLTDNTGTTEFDADFVSFESDGWKWDFTNNDQPGAQWFVFAVEENAAAGTVVQDVLMGPGIIPFAR